MDAGSSYSDESPEDQSPVPAGDEETHGGSVHEIDDDIVAAIPEWARKIRRELGKFQPSVASTAGSIEETAVIAKSVETQESATEVELPKLPLAPVALPASEVRRLAVVTLYSMDRGKEHSAGEAIARLEVMMDNVPPWPDTVFARVKAYLAHASDLDQDIKSCLTKYSLDRVGAVERAILRVGAAELRHCPDIPPRVTINECVELAKVYCEPRSYGFVNGVLDGIRRRVGKQDFVLEKPPQRGRRGAGKPVSEGKSADPTPIIDRPSQQTQD
jgi:N utilization substance protein B